MRRSTCSTTTSTRRGAPWRSALSWAMTPVMAACMAAGLWFGVEPASAGGSGTNGLILYAGWPSGGAGEQLYTFDAAAGHNVEISGSFVGDDEPAFSPDGRTIAFRHNGDLWTMNADGSGRKPLFHLSNGAGWPSWSPDGTKLTFGGTLTNEAGPDIWVVDADGSHARTLTSTHADDDPAWSPNGTSIAFTSRRDNNNPEIYRMNVDGTGQTNLTKDSSSLDTQPAFSPDSARIVFTSTKPRTDSVGPDLWTVTVTGTDLRSLNHAAHYSDGSDATYSPDGTEIAFAANMGLGGVQLWAVPVAGGTGSRLTGLPGNPGVSGTNWQQAPSSK